MNRREAERLARQVQVLQSLGFSYEEAEKLRRISMTLRRWHELECGDGNGCIERAEDGEGAPYWMSAHSGKSYRIPDREKGAHKRLATIIGQRNGRPAIVAGKLNAAPAGKVEAYIQGDPRGAALYILRPGDVPADGSAESYYTRGICVY